ncbi:MAG: hypothetical protein ABW007_19435 [Chitinophagaceae bacterium]
MKVEFQTLEVVTGNENYNNRSAEFNGFWCPRVTVPDEQGRHEQALLLALRYKNGALCSQGASRKTNAFQGLRADITGMWEEYKLAAPEGTVLKFKGKRTVAGSYVANVAVYIQVRHKAAYREMRFELTHNELSTREFAYVKGRFDILTPDQTAQCGVIIPPHFIGLSQPMIIQRHIKDVILEPEMVSLPKVEIVSVAPVENAVNNGPQTVIAQRKKIIRKR